MNLCAKRSSKLMVQERIQSDVARPTCLEPAELHKYLGVAVGYGWHISNLKIYDEPKKLGEFTGAAQDEVRHGACGDHAAISKLGICGGIARMNVVYNVDCFEYMRSLPDKAFDLAVVDPPYFSGPRTARLLREQSKLHRRSS